MKGGCGYRDKPTRNGWLPSRHRFAATLKSEFALLSTVYLLTAPHSWTIFVEAPNRIGTFAFGLS